MKKFSKHIAFLLLLVFSWVLLPASFVHEVFADHVDTDCHFDHQTAGSLVESIHMHCDVFKTNTPLYDVPKLAMFTQARPDVICEIILAIENSYFHLLVLDLPSRAPPLC